MDLIPRKYRLVPRGGPGLTCDGEGLALGPIILARRLRHCSDGKQNYKLLSPEAVRYAVNLAYGALPSDVLEQYYRGLARVVNHLAAGDEAVAGIEAVLLGFPEIALDRMAQLATFSSLHKYNPDWEDEPRVPPGRPGAGEWTGSGGEFQIAGSGNLKCDGFSAGCQSGGTFGTAAMYHIFGRNLCRDCAVKMMGLENLPGSEQTKTLERYLIER